MESLPVGREDVERAAGVIAGRLHRTPTLSCRTLGPHVFLKAELLQRTGSFKPRGVLTKLASLTPEEKARGVIAASAGNHAAALAFGAALEGIDALVVMYQGASEVKLRAVEGYGATMDLEATGPADVFERLDTLREKTGRVLVHPFDDPLVIAGQGTVGLEILEDVHEVERILVPCGGGGLFSG
ncbi:MAG: pyridoxal-phosphate dependent enzyme, partial [Actinobacteria bacterium]|nr:pyridoxal-phosphate dependent enzyme [Actinomycetota bacterium]